MKILLLLVITVAAIITAAWLLPWWLTLALLVVIVTPIAWIVWKVVSTIKRDIVPALKKVAEGMPRAQERLCSLPAGVAFRGNGFAFTFPVACDVSQMVIDDLEALVLQPKLEGPGESPKGLMFVSTIPREELKQEINDRLEEMFDRVKTHLAEEPAEGQEFHTEDFVPTSVGAFNGECRRLEASHDGKKIRGETVYLGEQAFSVGWALFGPAETFDATAARIREMAGMIQRVAEPEMIDLPSLKQGS
jgi:hypothetical protein